MANDLSMAKFEALVALTGVRTDMADMEWRWLASVVSPRTGSIHDMWQWAIQDTGYSSKYDMLANVLGYRSDINSMWLDYWTNNPGEGVGGLYLGPMSNVILDTDIASDCDDTAALAVLLRLQQLAEANIITIVTSSANAYSIAAAEAINMWGSTSRPTLGAYTGSVTTSSSDYAQSVAAEFGADGKTRTHYRTALSALRRSLDAAANNSVCMCIIGPLINLSDLLQSTADADSTYTGLELLRNKVRRLVIMGGDYPSSGSPEFNFADAKTAANYVFQNLWCDTFLIGYSLGNEFTCGPTVGADPAVNPIKRAYNLDTPGYTTRTAWDPVSVLFAVRGSASGLVPAAGRGTNVVSAADGGNVWTAGAGKAIYLTRSVSAASINAVLDGLVQGVVPATKLYSAFNPSDKTNANLLFSNSNTRLTHSGANAQLESRGDVLMVGSMKKYLEFKINLVTGTTNLMSVGLANSTHPFTDWLGATGNVIGYEQSGVYRSGGSAGTSPGLWDDGDTVCCAFDRSNQRVWFRKNNGLWNGSGTADPSTNTGGYNVGGMNDAYFIAMLSRAGDNLDIVTDPTLWTYSAPSGFYPLRA